MFYIIYLTIAMVLYIIDTLSTHTLCIFWGNILDVIQIICYETRSRYNKIYIITYHTVYYTNHWSITHIANVSWLDYRYNNLLYQLWLLDLNHVWHMYVCSSLNRIVPEVTLTCNCKNVVEVAFTKICMILCSDRPNKRHTFVKGTLVLFFTLHVAQAKTGSDLNRTSLLANFHHEHHKELVILPLLGTWDSLSLFQWTSNSLFKFLFLIA